MTMPSDLPAVAALSGDGEPLWGLGGLWIIKVSAAQTGGSFSLIEVRMKRGTGTPLHRHDLDEETFIVLEGTLALLAEPVKLAASDVPVTVSASIGYAEGYRDTPDELLATQAYDHGITFPSMQVATGLDVPLALGALRQGTDNQHESAIAAVAAI